MQDKDFMIWEANKEGLKKSFKTENNQMKLTKQVNLK